jgi:hypothetical protein
MTRKTGMVLEKVSCWYIFDYILANLE